MRLVSISLLLLLGSCNLPDKGLSTESAAQINIYRMRQISIGMTEEEVFQIMRYPTYDDQIVLQEGCYNIWFYITHPTVLGQSELLPHNLTPLIFKDGVYIGTGYNRYKKLLKMQDEAATATPAPAPTPPPAKPQLENIQLEKTLKAPANEPLGPPQKEEGPPAGGPTPEGGPWKQKPSKPDKPQQVSMSSKPANPRKDQNPDPEAEKKGFDEDDERMLKQEKEEDFNNW